MDKRRQAALNKITVMGGALIVVGVLVGLVIPGTYNGVGCGTAFLPKQFGSDLIETSVTRGCDTATNGMLIVSLVLVGIGLIVVLAALLMRVPADTNAEG